MTNPNHDYSAFAQSGHNSETNPTDLQELLRLAKDQLRAEKDVEEKETALKIAKDNLKEISEVVLPGKMDELGLPEFSTSDGIKIAVTEKVRASIAVERRPAANDWLEENGYGGLIKSEVVAAFGRDELKDAQNLVQDLKNNHIPAVLERTVHSSTLASFVREQLASGKDIPLDLFGVSRQRISKITIK